MIVNGIVRTKKEKRLAGPYPYFKRLAILIIKKRTPAFQMQFVMNA